MQMILLDGTRVTVRTRADVEQRWLHGAVSLAEAARVLLDLLELHPCNMDKVWQHLKGLR